MNLPVFEIDLSPDMGKSVVYMDKQLIKGLVSMRISYFVSEPPKIELTIYAGRISGRIESPDIHSITEEP